MKKLLSLVLVFVMLFTACGKAINTEWQEKYDLGMKYLTECNYEEAILSFTAAIEIDPKMPDAYLGLADAYAYQGNVLKALDVLKEGYKVTGNEMLNLKMEDLLERINLTGQPIFALSDLSEWGYPYGMTIYDYQARGEATEEQVNEWIDRYWDPAGSGGQAVHHKNPAVYFELNNMKIDRVSISDGDETIGPRGIRIGMSMEEVINHFYCSNQAAIDYVAGSSDTLSKQDDIQLYFAWEADTTWPEGEYNTQCFADLDAIEGELIYVTLGSGRNNRAELRMSFEDNVLSSFIVEYRY